ncbi:MAG: outer membrane protein transport protein [Candidatus Ozemobacteraceae bacterium]
MRSIPGVVCSRFILLLFVFLVQLSATPLLAAGYAIKEHSVPALGHAFAGTAAGAHDLTDSFFNPATLILASDDTAAFAFTSINVQAEMTDGAATNAAGKVIPGGKGNKDVGADAIVPAFFYAREKTPDLKFGFSLTAPWGLSSKNPAGWVGRYQAIDSAVKTMNFSPAMARRINERWTWGAGLQLQQMDANLTAAIDYGTVGAMLGKKTTPGTLDGFYDMKGNAWGYGLNLGCLYQPDPKSRIGLAWRSQVKHKLKGETEFFYDAAGVGSAIAGAKGLLKKPGTTADVTTPDVISLGWWHQMNPKWDIVADATFTRWSVFKELRAHFDDPNQPDAVTEENWKDTFFFSLGTTYRTNGPWLFRLGAACEQSPVPDATRNPRIPDSDRTWLSCGLGYQASRNISFDLGYAHFWMKNAPINLLSTSAGNALRGNLTGTFENAIDLLGVQANIAF